MILIRNIKMAISWKSRPVNQQPYDGALDVAEIIFARAVASSISSYELCMAAGFSALPDKKMAGIWNIQRLLDKSQRESLDLFHSNECPALVVELRSLNF